MGGSCQGYRDAPGPESASTVPPKRTRCVGVLKVPSPVPLPLRIYVQPRPPSGPLFAHSTRADRLGRPSLAPVEVGRMDGQVAM